MRIQQKPSLTSSFTLPSSNSWAPLNNPWAATVTWSKYVVCDSPSKWDQQVTERLNELVALPHNWDGYNGRGVLFENANFTVNILNKICEPHHSAPCIVPGNSGDLQLEWHTEHGDLELHIIAPNHVTAWYSILGDAPREGELDLNFDFAKVAEILGIISEAPIAAVKSTA